MASVVSTLTVMYDEPFWIALYEHTTGGTHYEVCKVTFGAQPKDSEVYEYFLKNFYKLRFSKTSSCEETLEKHINPKRMQRQIKKQLQCRGIGTKAQQAIKLEQVQNKIKRKKRSKAQKEAEKERHFALRQAKQKEKHKGH